MNKTLINILFLLAATLLTSSCVQHRQLINFNEANLPEDTPEQIVNAMNLTIQPEDALRIEVSSINEEAAAPFNLGAQGQQGGGNMQQMGGGGGGGGFFGLEIFQGYLVDQDGYIDFPVLGPLKVKGLTLEETKALIYGKLEEYLVNPVVNVRYLNLKITVLGEVNAPGLIRLSNKRVTLLEAIGMAGDLGDYANRNNVLVIREEEGRRIYTRLDLQSAEIFTSPYFYMQQNDVIYVEPIQARIATVADPAQRIISYTTAGLSLISLIIALSR
ncbi:MAG: polysaccharide biosynthesis/export family protein [Phaeodactylibacter xiamenensis]|uniref:Uncharacterized protein n=1 Tax=Phaeodactylibacter xiamenensis TaxID=1524460 RepID=A0A098S2N3_9BACT|nr:polysaccharide biosynthesis/export family protein [Phaeodactylibacter xiamenensis]KGE86629.1 hypothetical protein IX84_20285 [Phaeodactylibacter xiamenensis]